ncbi:unnamed protein product [Arabidopsis thaliana]|nr:unnamed protein product [Arabidopsis thaliana]
MVTVEPGSKHAGGPELLFLHRFDPKTHTWSSVTSPSAVIRNESVAEHKSLGLGGKFYLFGDDSDKSAVV